jgi:hypothetical protein
MNQQEIETGGYRTLVAVVVGLMEDMQLQAQINQAVAAALEKLSQQVAVLVESASAPATGAGITSTPADGTVADVDEQMAGLKRVQDAYWRVFFAPPGAQTGDGSEAESSA